MLRDVRRPTNYRAPINLYVEDRLTEAYLSELSSDSAVAFFIGGGNEGVETIAKVEQKQGYGNVFGLIDQDYRPTNQSKWHDPLKNFTVFILPVHEIENYVLDADPMRSSRYHNRNLSRDEIEQFFTTRAGLLCWWAACREVIAELRKRFREGFITDPSLDVDQESASRHICDSTWFKNLSTEAARSSETDVGMLLTTAHSQALLRLQDNSWRSEFSGKEIFKDATSRICHQPGLANAPTMKAEFFEDLAKDIAAWQVENNRVPLDLIDLLDALKRRIARS